MTTATPELLGVERAVPPDATGGEVLRLRIADGWVRCRFHAPIDDTGAAVVWVSGAGGGLGGPAGGMYERMAHVLRPRGVASLQVDYRRPARLDPCVEDALAGTAFLEARGSRRIALVGHSFGGAVAIRAGTERAGVVGVAALSSQLSGTDGVADLYPRPLLLIHGEADEVLPPDCSREIYRRAREPKELLMYPGCRHGLDACRDALERDLGDWLEAVLRPRR